MADDSKEQEEEKARAASEPQIIDPIVERWTRLARRGYEIDVGTELLCLAKPLDSLPSVKRTYFPSGLIVPKRFELLREQTTKEIVVWAPDNARRKAQLVRRDVVIVVGHIKPVSLFGVF